MSSPPAHILVVEDEVLIRLMAIDVVEDAGCIACAACDAADAIRCLEARDDIAVMFTDIDMPGMNGLALAALVRARWPGIAIVVTSGEVEPEAQDLPDGGIFVPKPYVPSDVCRLLAELTTA